MTKGDLDALGSVRRTVIFGAGGHAREVAGLLSRLPGRVVEAFVVDSSHASGQQVNSVDGIPVIGWTALASQRPLPEMVVAVGDGQVRREVASRLPGSVSFPSVCALDAVIGPHVRLGAGTVICSASVLTTGIVVGDHSHINVGTTVSHDVVIGQFVTVSPGVTICGNVTIGDGAFIGAGATIINGLPGNPLVIGENAFVAAGACVVSDVSAGERVGGVPARVMRSVGGTP